MRVEDAGRAASRGVRQVVPGESMGLVGLELDAATRGGAARRLRMVTLTALVALLAPLAATSGSTAEAVGGSGLGTGEGETLTVPGLQAPVTIHTDPWGVPHVVSEDPQAMAYGFGYAEASERLFLMDVIRRMGQGRISELLGDGSYEADVVMRREFYDADDFDRQIDELPEHVVALLQRYADGVNQALAETLANPTELPAVYAALGDAPRPWTVHDSATVLNMFTAVSFAASGEGGELENLDRYLAMQDLHGADADDVWDDVMWSLDPEAVSVIPDADAAAVPDGLERADRVRPHPDQLALAERDPDPGLSEVEAAMRSQLDALREAMDQLPVPKVGSYAVALGAEQTASGGGLLLGAPQAGMTFPSTFHEVGIQTPGWECQGMTVPGLGPMVGIGWCNGHAWTLVAGNAGDQVDVYVETLDPEDPGRYLHDGESHEFRERTETFLVKSTLDGELDLRQETFEYSRHGAVFARDEEAGVAYTTRRAQDGRSVANYEGLHLLNTSPDGVTQIMDGLDAFTASYNLTLADDAGDIGYAFTGLQPLRAEGYDHRFAMPGTGEAEWEGFIPAEQMPQVVNPTDGLLVVNQGVESKPVWWWPSSSGQQIGRANRVADNRDLILGEPGGWDADRLADFDRRLIETREPFTERFARHIDAAFRGPLDEELRAIAPYWRAWRDSGFERSDDNGDGHYDQVAAAIFQPDRYYGMSASPLWGELYRATVSPHLPEGQAWGHYFAQLSLLERVLGRDRDLALDYLDDPATSGRERPADRMREAIRATLPQLAERYGSDDPADWRIPVTELSFDVAGISGPRSMQVLDHGTYNFVVDLAEKDARSILPPGNGSADTLLEEGGTLLTGELPPNADDQIELYEAWDHKPMHRTDVDEVAVETRTLVPLPLPPMPRTWLP